jgi:hypothetical protein
MSGTAGQGGIDDFNTYLLMSGCLHSGQAGQMGRRGFGLSHLQGVTAPQFSQVAEPFEKPSAENIH